jgi:ABC-type Fe3+ transport system permease subunit
MNAKNATALFLSVAFLLLFIVHVIPHVTSWQVMPAEALRAGEALWKGRTYEVILQGFIMLAGVMAILLLLGLNHSRRQQS